MRDDPEKLGRLIAEQMPQAVAAEAAIMTAYVELVIEYSTVLNLTGFRREPEHLAAELVGEALRLHQLATISSGTRAADLGSGNGSPVVPLAVLNPQARFTAVESRARPAAFLRTAQAKLSLDNFAVAELRAEQLAMKEAGAFGLVTSRAFAPLDKLVPLAFRLLAPGGELRGYLGADANPLSSRARSAGFTVTACEQYKVVNSRRHVYRLRKHD